MPALRSMRRCARMPRRDDDGPPCPKKPASACSSPPRRCVRHPVAGQFSCVCVWWLLGPLLVVSLEWPAASACFVSCSGRDLLSVIEQCESYVVDVGLFHFPAHRPQRSQRSYIDHIVFAFRITTAANPHHDRSKPTPRSQQTHTAIAANPRRWRCSFAEIAM